MNKIGKRLISGALALTMVVSAGVVVSADYIEIGAFNGPSPPYTSAGDGPGGWRPPPSGGGGGNPIYWPSIGPN